MIEEAKKIDEADKKEAYLIAIANFMKMAYITWNKEFVQDEQIYKDLEMFMGEPLPIDTTQELTRSDLRKAPKRHNTGGRKNYSKNNNNNRKGKKPYKRH